MIRALLVGAKASEVLLQLGEFELDVVVALLRLLGLVEQVVHALLNILDRRLGAGRTAPDETEARRQCKSEGRGSQTHPS